MEINDNKDCVPNRCRRTWTLQTRPGTSQVYISALSDGWKFADCSTTTKNYICERVRSIASLRASTKQQHVPPRRRMRVQLSRAPRRVRTGFSRGTRKCARIYRRYPCYHQPDSIIDWCKVMTLTDTSCASSNLQAVVPSVGVGYAAYLDDLISGNNPPTSISLAINSPARWCRTRPYFTAAINSLSGRLTRRRRSLVGRQRAYLRLDSNLRSWSSGLHTRGQKATSLAFLAPTPRPPMVLQEILPQPPMVTRRA